MNENSKKIDSMFQTDRNPAKIAGFLISLGERAAADAIHGSCCAFRLFYADFLGTMPGREQARFMELIIKATELTAGALDPAYFTVLARQVLATNSSVADRLKYEFDLKRRVGEARKKPFFCPGDGCRFEIKGVDAAIAAALRHRRVADALNSLSGEEFSKYANRARTHSAYFPRILQYDVYRGIGECRRRFEFLKLASPHAAFQEKHKILAETCEKFVRQLLESDCPAPEKAFAVENYAFEKMRRENCRKPLVSDFENEMGWIRECGNFAEFRIKSDVLCADLTDCAHFMALNGMFEMLSQWISRDRKEFNSISGMENVIKYRYHRK